MNTVEEHANSLRAALLALVSATADEEVARAHEIERVLPRHRQSATNLAHYLALRSRDVHRLQLELAAAGLSSLGRCEGHVRDILLRLCAWLSGARNMALAAHDRLDRARAEAILHANTRALFGERPAGRHVYIMVTAPGAAEATAAWSDDLLDAGVDLLRINGAQGVPCEWDAIASTFKSRAAVRGRHGRVIVDLPGPKLRIEITELEDAVVHLPRGKDRRGRTLAPTPVWLVPAVRGGAQIPVPPEWLAQLEAGDVIELTDAGERRRRLIVGERQAAGVRASCDRSLYVASGLPLSWQRGRQELGHGLVGALPRAPRVLSLDVGEVFLLNDSGKSDEMRALMFPEPPILAQVRVGERVILDEGRLMAVVRARCAGGVVCQVKHAVKSPTRLRSGKGIAFPDSTLTLGELGPQDEAALAFALEHADGVAVSFVNTARDVTMIGERIRRSGKPDFGMLLKLETRGAMNDLPAILFAALKYHPVGLMIARGDLAVELSFERLAEMQEELLWLGEACHLPVVWATQVLDTAARRGVPTRAEVTDAAMSMRAECVMLNKGPYIAEATRMLADIIRKMEAHQYKKRSLYRKLAVAQTEPRAEP